MKKVMTGLILTLAFCGFAQAQTQDVEINKESILELEQDLVTMEDFDGLIEALALSDEDVSQPNRPDRPKRPGMQACRAINATPGQIESLRQVFFTHKRNMIRHMANLKLAKLDFVDAILDSSKSAKDVEPLVTTVSSNVGGIGESAATVMKDIFFTVLTQDQRRPALKCMMAMMKMKKMKKKHHKKCRRHKHPGHKHPGHKHPHPPKHPGNPGHGGLR